MNHSSNVRRGNHNQNRSKSWMVLLDRVPEQDQDRWPINSLSDSNYQKLNTLNTILVYRNLKVWEFLKLICSKMHASLWKRKTGLKANWKCPTYLPSLKQRNRDTGKTLQIVAFQRGSRRVKSFSQRQILSENAILRMGAFAIQLAL